MDNIHLNIIGLSLDIIGVLFIYFFGLPSNFNKGDIRITEGKISNCKKLKNKAIITFSVTGITLVVIGFIIQIISQVCILPL
jgi:hypothetical protein